MKEKVRVRFAPSPTGGLHIGGVRTALYNYLFARQYKGDFVLRIEDTDQSRFVEGAERYIIETLQWLDITPDESPVIGGEYGPYRQSERKNYYNKYANYLLDNEKAYYAFDTPAELEAMRQRLKEAQVTNPVYDSASRETMVNSLTLSREEVQKKLSEGFPYVIRLKVPVNEEITVNDLIRGEVTVHTSNIDDKILVKSDGMPTYHLANVVDDHLMAITHVIRGEEWLPSAPLHSLLYDFLGWKNTMPAFAHLPLLLKPDGNGKLSKRAADKLGFPIFPLDWNDPRTHELSTGFREQGYLPETVINFLALLGWNPGTEQEIFSLAELIETFSISRIHKSGAKFDIEKAKWFNQHYIRQKDDAELAGTLMNLASENKVECEMAVAIAITRLLKERITFPNELWSMGQFFFFRPTDYDPKIIKKKWNAEVAGALDLYKNELENIEDLNAETAHSILQKIAELKTIPIGKILPVLRLVITGTGFGPDLMGVIEVLGKDEVMARIEIALEKIAVK